MKVNEYASSMNLSVAEVLKKCSELGIKASSKDSFLEDDDVIILDNVFSLISTENDTSLDEEDVIDQAVDEIMELSSVKHAVDDNIRKQKLKKKNANGRSSDEYQNKRKAMYKHKTKLKTNTLEKDVVLYHENMTVKDLAQALDIDPTDIIKKLMALGLMLNINQTIDYENAEIIALEYNKTLKKDSTRDLSNFEEYEVVDDENDLVKRPPVVTIMGHVDHGKTTLLDYIRHSSVASSEFGGITQHIGAYQVESNGNKITFIDTPGHAAFTQMRARGASITDVVIIIVAADDGVMPQTKEAVDHALAAKVPIIVAVNKIDKPEANPEKIKTEMAEINITPEEWGGNVPFVNISAATGEGIDLLLETIIAIAEMNELKANPKRYAVGTVIESKIDKHVGGVSSLLIQNGTLRLGDPIVVGHSFGKIRTMKNDLGESIVEAGPSTPVEVTGISENPEAGDKFMAFETEAQAKQIAQKRKNIFQEQKVKNTSLSLDDLFEHINAGNKEINVVLKADVKGSEEAVRSALEKIDVQGVKINIIRSGIGTISESDVVLAQASNAIIIGFNVSPSNMTKEIAKEYSVEIRLYTIIYKVVEEMELAMKGMLDPEFEEKILGSAEVRQLFKFSKVGTIAGSYVLEGVLKNNSSARIIRDGVIIHDGKISSLQRGKDSVKEVKKGFECGITMDAYNDIKEKDIIECYEMVEIKRV